MGEAIVQFVKRKPAPFPRAMLSKRDFLQYAPWQRGMVFLFLVRHVLDLHATLQWKKYCPKELKLNMRLMHRYKQRDKEIIMESPTFTKLPATSALKRKINAMSPTSSESSPAKVTRRTIFDIEEDGNTTGEESDETGVAPPIFPPVHVD